MLELCQNCANVRKSFKYFIMDVRPSVCREAYTPVCRETTSYLLEDKNYIGVKKVLSYFACTEQVLCED